MAPVTIQINEFLPAEQAVHLVRSTLTRQRPKQLHGHDFHEVIWVQNGRLRHHLPGERQDLSEGEMLFVGPEHRHALQGLEPDTLVVAILFRSALISRLGERYPEFAGRTFWPEADVPARARRNSSELAVLNHAALALERGRRDALAAEAFLVPLLDQLGWPTDDIPESAPDWLREACAASERPEVFRDGAAGFVRVSGKAHAHVSRTAQAILGRSPTDFINERRMDYAGRRLVGSDDSLGEIAEDCGIANMSHFHKLFRARYGTTPQRYRTTHQKEVVQPR